MKSPISKYSIKRKYLFAGCALLVLICVGVILLCLYKGKKSKTDPIVIIYVTTNNSPYLGVFFITNQTDDFVYAKITGLETFREGEWIAQTDFPGGLYLQASGSDYREVTLKPHEAEYCTCQLSSISVPSNSLWRAKATMHEQLSGLKKFKDATKDLPFYLTHYYQNGNNGTQINPFDTRMTRFGNFRTVYSLPTAAK